MRVRLAVAVPAAVAVAAAVVVAAVFGGRSSYFYTPRGGPGRGIRVPVNFEILSEFVLYVELSNKNDNFRFL